MILFLSYVGMELRGVEPITTVPDVAQVFGQWAGTNIFSNANLFK